MTYINRNFNGYWVRSRDITYADDTVTVGAIAVPANTYVQKVIAYIETAFSTGGSVDCGDGTDPDGWIDTTQMSASNTGVKIGTGGDSAFYITGKGYTTADTIDVYVADKTSGSMFIAAYLVPLADVFE